MPPPDLPVIQNPVFDQHNLQNNPNVVDRDDIAQMVDNFLSGCCLFQEQDVIELELIPPFGQNPTQMDQNSLMASLIIASHNARVTLGLNAVVINPMFTMYVNRHQIIDNADNYFVDSPAMVNAHGYQENWDVLIFPIQPHAGHWTSLYYVRGSPNAHYYEPYNHMGEMTAEIERRVRQGISEFTDPNFAFNELQIQTVDNSHLNEQTDGWNCGFFAVSNMETRLLSNNFSTRLPNFDIRTERQRWVSMLRNFVNTGVPEYIPRPNALNVEAAVDAPSSLDQLFPSQEDNDEFSEVLNPIQRSVDPGFHTGADVDNTNDMEELAEAAHPRRSSRIAQRSNSLSSNSSSASSSRQNNRYGRARVDDADQCPNFHNISHIIEPETRRCKHVHKISNVNILNTLTGLYETRDVPLGCAALSTKHLGEYYDVGNLGDVVCGFCKALLYKGETSSFCCANGQVRLEPIQHQPSPLLDLLTKSNNFREQPILDVEGIPIPSAAIKRFQKYIRKYNKLLSIASCRAKQQQAPPHGVQAVLLNGDWTLDMFDLECGPNQSPALLQTYMLNTADALEAYRNNRIDYDPNRVDDRILDLLQRMLRECNPFVRDLMTLREMIAQQSANAPEQPLLHYRITFLNHRQVPTAALDDNNEHPRAFMIPEHISETAAIWCSADGEPPFNDGTMVTNRQGCKTHIPLLSPNADPFGFILLFPQGQPGYHFGIRKHKVSLDELNQSRVNSELWQNDITNSCASIVSPSRVRQVAARVTNATVSNNAVNVSRIHLINNSDIQDDIENNEGSGANVSAAQFFLFHVQIRGKLQQNTNTRPRLQANSSDPHFLSDTRSLFQEFVEYYAFKILQNRSTFWKNAQKDLRRSIAEEVVGAFARGLGPNQQLGKIFLMPKTMKGSRASMQEFYGNIKAIERKEGKWTFMITMTMDPTCPEVVRALKAGQNPVDRPDIVERIFNIKLKLLTKLIEDGALGPYRAMVWVKEWQGRYLPHVHMLVNCDVPPVPEIVDQYVHARLPPLPNPEDFCRKAIADRRYRELVLQKMVHDCWSRCAVNPPRRDGKCAKGFKKDWSAHTVLYTDRPHHYKRISPRDGGEVTTKRFGNRIVQVDDSVVVPHNRKLLEEFGCHINVEYIYGDDAARYGTKGAAEYLTKGAPMMYVRAERGVSRPGEPEIVDYDEYNHFKKAVHMGPCQAWTHITNYPMFFKSHTVYSLPVHLEGQQPVFFATGQEAALATNILEGRGRMSELMAYLQLCRENPNQPEHQRWTFVELPHYFWFDKKSRKWIERQNSPGKLVSQIYLVSPRNINLFALRLLLFVVRWPKTFDEIRTVEGVVFPTFVEAAQMLNLLEDDHVWRRSMLEAAVDMGLGPARMRNFFVQIILNGQPDSPLDLWEEFHETMYRGGNLISDAEKSRRMNIALRQISYLLDRQGGVNNAMCGLPIPVDLNNVPFESDPPELIVRRYFFPNQRHWNDDDEDDTVEPPPDNINRLNDEQRDFLERIEVALTTAPSDPNYATTPRLFGISGSGGTGKTTLFNTIISRCLRNGVYIFATATTGIAATLMFNGSTVHSAFGLGISIDPNNFPQLEYQSLLAQRIRSAQVIIMDEMSVCRRELFEAVENICRTTAVDGQNHLPFGGKVIILGYDFKQLLPIVENETGHWVQVANSIQASPLFQDFVKLRLLHNMRVGPGEQEFAAWLELVGRGANFICYRTLSIDLLEGIRVVNTMEELIDFVHYETNQGGQRVLTVPTNRCDNAILAPLNEHVDSANRTVLNQLPGEDVIFYSTDQPFVEPDAADIHIADFDVATFNAVRKHRIPPHQLVLRVGAVVILLRNVDIQKGLCNGTRMIVERLGHDVIVCRVMTTSSMMYGQLITLNRFKFEYNGVRPNGDGLHFWRTQFPIRLAFTMSINKAQGSTLNRVGLCLITSVFCPGQLYVALSRVRNVYSVVIFAPSALIVDGRVRLKNIVARGINFD